MIDNEQDYIGRDASSDRADAVIWLLVKVMLFWGALALAAEVIRDGF